MTPWGQGVVAVEEEQRNVEAIRRWFREVWGERREATIDELFVPDGLAYGLGPEPIVGPPGFKPFFHLFCEMFSEISYEEIHCFGAGDRVALHGRFRVVSSRTGAVAHILGGGVARLENGMLQEAWNAWDFLATAIELGCLPADTLERCLRGEKLS